MTFSTPRLRLVPLVATALAVAFSLPLRSAMVDPDPELFDGARTKKDQVAQDKKPKSDKWTESNLILYDSDEEGSEEGGQGRVGGEGPGFADGVQAGVQGGLPIPMMGGSGAPSGQQGSPGMMIPTTEQQSSGAGQQSAQTPGNPSGQGNPGEGKPGEVGIGDANQKIAASAQPAVKTVGGTPPPAGGEAEQPKGTDTTNVPSAASGPQSGKRGGGVEKGDAMPTDI